MVLVGVKGKDKEDKSGSYLKVDAITDEFCRLTKTGDALAKLNAVTKGDLYDSDEMEAIASTSISISKLAHEKEPETGNGKPSKRKRGKAANEAKKQNGKTQQPSLKKRKSSKKF